MFDLPEAAGLNISDSLLRSFPEMIGQNVSHYRVLSQLGAAGWAWCTKPRTSTWAAVSR